MTLLNKFSYHGRRRNLEVDSSNESKKGLNMMRAFLKEALRGDRVSLHSEISRAEIMLVDSQARLIINKQVSVVLDREEDIFRLAVMLSASVPLMVVLMYISLMAEEKSLKFESPFGMLLGLEDDQIFCDASSVAMHDWAVPEEEGFFGKICINLFDLNYDVHRSHLVRWMLKNHLYVLLPADIKKNDTDLSMCEFRVKLNDLLAIEQRSGRSNLRFGPYLLVSKEYQNLREVVIRATLLNLSSREVLDFYERPEWYVHDLAKLYKKDEYEQLSGYLRDQDSL